MEKRVLIDTWQKVTKEDFLKIGLFPQGSLDSVVGRLLIPDMAFSGFMVTQTGPAEVTVAEGRLFVNGKVFFNATEGGTPKDLLARLPATTGRIVAITAWGQELDSKNEPRTFLADQVSRAVVARETPTEHWRWANIDVVSGLEGPDPQPPSVPTDVMVLAWVRLSTTGVESIQMNVAGYAPSLRATEARLNGMDMWKLVFGGRLDTLASDLLALSSKIYGLATFNLVRQIARDVAVLKDRDKLPDLYTSYGLDHYLTDVESDLLHVDWNAKIEEGVRFPPAAGFDMQLGALNPFDEGVINTANVLLPAWDAAIRISNVRLDSDTSLAQYQVQTVSMVQKTMSRTVIRYGTPFTVCSNGYYWNSDGTFGGTDFMGTFDYVSFTYRRTTGEVFNIAGDWIDYASGSNIHHIIRLQQVWTDTIEEPYWDRITTTASVPGSVVAQSFVNSQDGWLCALNLYFSRAGSTGNVEVVICETTNGQPDPSKVIARSTLTAGSIIVATQTTPTPTRVSFVPTYIRKGRYAILLITTGNHYVWTIDNSNFISGTLFNSTDGSWFLGDLQKDLCFEALFCQFRNNYTVCVLQSLQLQNGIAAIDINADSIVPEGCRLFYEVQVNGVWHALDNVDGGPSAVLNGLPPLLPFRAVFVGSASLQPALGVASNSRVTTWRPKSDFVHISSILALKAAANHLQVDIRVESWRTGGAPAHNTLITRLMTGASYNTLLAPTTTTSEPAPDDPSALIYHYAWTGISPTITTFRLRLDGHTDNVLQTYHVAERFHIVS